MNGFRDCVSLLVDHKPDITLKNAAGHTAGALAASKGHMELAALCGYEPSEDDVGAGRKNSFFTVRCRSNNYLVSRSSLELIN